MSDIILKAMGILKRYPGNVALDHVDLTLYRNAVNVLIGENGAGKSTLMRILSGVESCDEGVVQLDGHEIVLRSPRDATAHGISIVHQELSVMPNLDISENIFAGREITKSIVVDRKTEDRRSQVALERLRMPMSVTGKAAQLSLGCRQIVELARTIVHGAKILILDEPTSALSTNEAESLFEVIRELKESGVTIVYISHRLHELLYLGDYFTVLRSGRVVGEARRSEVTRSWIVERMSGLVETGDLNVREPVPVDPILSVEGLSLLPSVYGEDAQAPLLDINLTVNRGEVLGIYGLLGAGRTELLETLAGNRKPASGTVTVDGKRLSCDSVENAVRTGVVLVPEDRQRDGLIPELSIRENVALAAASGPFLWRSNETAQVFQLARDLNIAVRDLELPVTVLSGGNQQKVLIARCLMRKPTMLLLDEPTRGVDVGAKAEIYRILRRLAAGGLSILFTSSEIEETKILADRALVLCQGRISAQFEHRQITDEALFAAASPIVITTGFIA
jgi:erythritol transport system ATP-binding protein